MQQANLWLNVENFRRMSRKYDVQGISLAEFGLMTLCQDQLSWLRLNQGSIDTEGLAEGWGMVCDQLTKTNRIEQNSKKGGGGRGAARDVEGNA